jgi:hypothetical protein
MLFHAPGTYALNLVFEVKLRDLEIGHLKLASSLVLACVIILTKLIAFWL